MHVPLSSQIQGENRQTRSVSKQTSFWSWLQALCVSQSPAEVQVGLTPSEGTGPHAACLCCDRDPGLPLCLPITSFLQIVQRRPVRLAPLHRTAWLGRVVDARSLRNQLRRPSKLLPLPQGGHRPDCLLSSDGTLSPSALDMMGHQQAACLKGSLEPYVFG